MTTRYNINDYSKGQNGFGLPFCDTIFTSTLAANTAATVTISGNPTQGPTVYTTDFFLAVMSYEPDTLVWVANNQTAAVPAGDTFAASTSEINPPCKLVKAGDILSFISTAAAGVSVAIYSFLQN